MTRRKDGLWQQQYTVTENGKKKQKYFYGKTKKEVLDKIRAYEASAAAGRTFGEVAEDWWEEAEPQLAYNTTKGYRPALRRAVEEFGEDNIRELKPLDISRYIRRFVKETHAADKTARTQLMVINLICRYAVESGDLEYNPARDITVPKGLEKKPREIASDDDIAKVKASTDCTFGMFAYWIMYTGMRRGELLALTWDDVDVEECTISISKSVYHVDNKPYIKQPKTAKGIRTVPLLNKLGAKIKPAKGLVFPDPATGGIMTNMHFQSLWDKYASESGISCTAHQLRHAYATMLEENDVSEKDAQYLLGHAQISTTKDIYTHIRETKKEKIKSKLLDLDI